MHALLDVVRVKAEPNYGLVLEFENGEIRRFDMAPYMDMKPWLRIKNPTLFLAARVEMGTVVWPNNIDMDPETLYERSVAQPAMPIGALGAPYAMETR